MNNCPKCGNPLQAGVTSCPICGTNISIENESKQVAVESVVATATPAPAQASVAPAPVVEAPTPAQPAAPVVSAPEAPAQPIAPVVEKPAEAPAQPAAPAPAQPVVPVAPAPAAPEAPAQAQPMTPVQPVAPVPAPETPANPAAPAAPETPALAPEAPTQPAEPALTPASERPVDPPIQSAAVTPTIANVVTPASSDDTTATSGASTAPAPAQATDKKKKGNVLLPVLIILVVAVGGIAAYMNFFNKPATNLQPTGEKQQVSNVKMVDVSSHGFKFKLPEDWTVTEDGQDLIATNEKETVYVKLEHSETSIAKLNADSMKEYLESKEKYQDIEVTNNKINAKDSFLVNATYNDMPIQLYFIGGGTDLTLGVVTIYVTPESKTVNETTVQEMIGTISYADEKYKAISTISMFSDVYSAYDGIMANPDYRKSPLQFETPEPEEPDIEGLENAPADNPNNEIPTETQN